MNQEHTRINTNQSPSRELTRAPPKQSSTSFFAIFYERPARRRYYRQFSRSATNLTRRLSRSRLFLGSSQHRNAHQNNTAAALSEQRPIETISNTPPNIIQASVHNENVISVSERMHDGVPVRSTSEVNICSLERYANEIDERVSSSLLTINRADTPPPPYTILAKE